MFCKKLSCFLNNFSPLEFDIFASQRLVFKKNEPFLLENASNLTILTRKFSKITQPSSGVVKITICINEETFYNIRYN